MPSNAAQLLLLLLGAAASTTSAIPSPSMDEASVLAARQASTETLPALTNFARGLDLSSRAVSQANQTAIGLAGFDYFAVTQRAADLSKHSWEWGTASEALLEAFDPKLSVYGASSTSFPKSSKGKIPVKQPADVLSLAYAKKYIALNSDTLVRGDGSAGDPASLGVAAVMLGQTNGAYLTAANKQATHLLTAVPRYSNGAISHRENVAELWADNLFMVPPFLAYYAVATNSEQRLVDVVTQIGLQRQILGVGGDGAYRGLWKHIVGPQSQTLGIWSTGNAWAALGTTRVLATIYHSQPSSGPSSALSAAALRLTRMLQTQFDGMLAARDKLDNGLVRNYIIGDVNGIGGATNWWGEAAGTAGLVSAVYRLAALNRIAPSANKIDAGKLQGYILWADQARRAIVRNNINAGSKIVAPTVNPYDWYTRTQYWSGSPEGNAFVGMMGAAYVDCLNIGACKR